MRTLRKKMMILKIAKTVAGLTSIVGFIYILGTAGSSDLDLISFGEIIHKSLVGLALFSGGFFSIWFLEKHEVVLKEKIFHQKKTIREQRERSRKSIETCMRITERKRHVEQMMKELERL